MRIAATYLAKYSYNFFKPAKVVERSRWFLIKTSTTTLLSRNYQRYYSGISTMNTSSEISSSSMEQHFVCKVDDLKDNEMREFEIPIAGSVLLVKLDGKFSALGPKCSHYGAPLAKGVLCNGRIRCPWHGACFNATTGDIEDYPGLDSLSTFEVAVEDDGKVFIKTSKQALQNPIRVKPLIRPDLNNKRTVLIVGGGPAALTCAEILRQEGFSGRVVIATDEIHPPYDRPKLSKVMDVDPKNIYLRPLDFYSESGIEFLTNKEAVEVDVVLKKVNFKDGPAHSYDQLLLATGGRPRQHRVPGSNLRNVCYLRSPADARNIYQNGKNKAVVIVGSSFIGMESASVLVEVARSVTVVGRNKVPFEAIFGHRIGSAIKQTSIQLFETNNVKFQTSATVVKYEGSDGKVTKVVLDNGESLEADLVLVGVGVTPATDFLSTSGIPMTKDGFVIVNSRMQTEANNVYAAGDIVQFPLFLRDGQLVSIGHWQMAHAQGRTAALNILNRNQSSDEIPSVPYFWTVLFKKSLRYSGYGDGYDETVIDGDETSLQFVAYYLKNKVVVAVATMNSDPVASKFAELLYSGKTLRSDDIQDSKRDWLTCMNMG